MNHIGGELRDSTDPVRVVRLWMLLPVHGDAIVHDDRAADIDLRRIRVQVDVARPQREGFAETSSGAKHHLNKVSHFAVGSRSHLAVFRAPFAGRQANGA